MIWIERPSSPNAHHINFVPNFLQRDLGRTSKFTNSQISWNSHISNVGVAKTTVPLLNCDGEPWIGRVKRRVRLIPYLGQTDVVMLIDTHFRLVNKNKFSRRRPPKLLCGLRNLLAQSLALV